MESSNFNYLKAVPYLAGFSKSTLNYLSQHGKIKHFRKGELVLQQGEANQFIGVVISGLVRQFEKMDNQEENVWALFKENDFVACPYVLMGEQYAATSIEAIEETRILQIDKAAIDKLLQKYPTFKASTYQTLSRQMMELMHEKSKLLNMTATERYAYFLRQYADIVFRVPLGHISTFLGIRQSSLSRIRRNFSQGKHLPT